MWGIRVERSVEDRRAHAASVLVAGCHLRSHTGGNSGLSRSGSPQASEDLASSAKARSAVSCGTRARRSASRASVNLASAASASASRLSDHSLGVGKRGRGIASSCRRRAQPRSVAVAGCVSASSSSTGTACSRMARSRRPLGPAAARVRPPPQLAREVTAAAAFQPKTRLGSAGGRLVSLRSPPLPRRDARRCGRVARRSRAVPDIGAACRRASAPAGVPSAAPFPIEAKAARLIERPKRRLRMPCGQPGLGLVFPAQPQPAPAALIGCASPRRTRLGSASFASSPVDDEERRLELSDPAEIFGSGSPGAWRGPRAALDLRHPSFRRPRLSPQRGATSSPRCGGRTGRNAGGILRDAAPLPVWRRSFRYLSLTDEAEECAPVAASAKRICTSRARTSRPLMR